jgi:outer membrane protein assembly factor BamA
MLWCVATALRAPAQIPVSLYLAPAETAAFSEAITGFRQQPSLSQSGIAQFQANDSAAVSTLYADLLRHFRQQSHLAASLDSIRWQPVASAGLYLGPAMRWVALKPGPALTRDELRAAGFREKQITGGLFRHDVVLQMQQAILEQAENSGFPFARIWFDSIRLAPDGGVSAIIQLDRGRFFTFKQIKIGGNVKLPSSFLPNYLGIKPGSPYSRAQVLRVRDQLRTLAFAESAGDPTVTFSGGEATLNVYLQKKRAGRFDFIVGLLPQPGAGNKLLLTGSLSAAFQNALNMGERFSAEFERLRPETQKLEIQAGIPYIFGSPFGVEGQLHIFRRDSTWVDARSDFGVSYLFAGGDYVRFLWENKSSSLQKVDTLALLNTRRLPPTLDLRQNGFGLEIAADRLDYRFNPRRGWALQIKAIAGFNNVRRNTQIENLRDPDDPGFDFASLYDSVAGRESRYRLEGLTEIYIPLFQRATFKAGLRGGGIFSEKPVFNNEQYRLGGNKRLRGFNEESLFATRFAIVTTEIRLLIGRNSFLSAFADFGYIENITRNVRVFQRPTGVGAGLNFETQAGIFGISMAAGKTDAGQAIDFRALKFHLGYVSLF